ncbi:MAG: hypothetical protein JRD68_13370 [Deltaproteobacteria bacterium]|nr:hypothetical protein [Deltaproteobacteria bacterium]
MIWYLLALGLGGFIITEVVRYLVKNGWVKKLTELLENKIQLNVKFGAIIVFIGFALISLGHALGG